MLTNQISCIWFTNKLETHLLTTTHLLTLSLIQRHFYATYDKHTQLGKYMRIPLGCAWIYSQKKNKNIFSLSMPWTTKHNIYFFSGINRLLCFFVVALIFTFNALHTLRFTYHTLSIFFLLHPSSRTPFWNFFLWILLILQTKNNWIETILFRYS